MHPLVTSGVAVSDLVDVKGAHVVEGTHADRGVRVDEGAVHVSDRVYVDEGTLHVFDVVHLGGVHDVLVVQRFLGHGQVVTDVVEDGSQCGALVCDDVHV